MVDVRLRRTNHPESVRKSIYDRIISEREKMADAYKSEGDRLTADQNAALNVLLRRERQLDPRNPWREM